MNLSRVTGLNPEVMPVPSNELELPTCHVGVEIEVEGSGCIYDSFSSEHWDVKRDGSLRNNGREVVMKRPTMGQGILNAFNELETIIDTSRADYSHRTSVHVHIDIRDMSVEQLFNMLFFYIYCEKAIFNYIGHDREENNYCIPWWKTEELKSSLYSIYEAMQDDDSERIRYIIGDHMNKYSALNLKVINQFGSVEFRHHYGTHEKDRLLEWTNILMSLKKQALDVSHDHNNFESLITEHFQVPDALVPFMTEEVTYKGMAFLNEIYHACRMSKVQLQERDTLAATYLRSEVTTEHLQQLDNFNQLHNVSNLRPRRGEGNNEEDVSLFVGGSTITDGYRANNGEGSSRPPDYQDRNPFAHNVRASINADSFDASEWRPTSVVDATF